MRMWKINPRLLCRAHLLGEHVEMHMFVGSILKGINLSGYIVKGLVEVHNIAARHKRLADEMIRRGMRHQSPLPYFDRWKEGWVDTEENIILLGSRCKDCRRRIEKVRRTIWT